MSISILNKTTGQLQPLAGIPVDLLNAKQDKMQFATMPTASADNLGQIVQFVGTTGTYANGYFYRCVSDGESTPTYSWEPVTQESSGGTFVITLTENSGTYTADKTPAEVAEAYANGLLLLVESNGAYAYLNGASTYSGMTIYAFNSVTSIIDATLVSSGSKVTSIVATAVILTTNNGTTWSNVAVQRGEYKAQDDLTLITASASEEGRIYQHTGATGNGFVHGYFYECVSDGAVSPTYSWEQFNVQPSAPAVFTITLTGSGTQADPYVVDKTPAEVAAAYAAGQVLQICADENIYYLNAYEEASSTVFYSFNHMMIIAGQAMELRIILAASSGSWNINVSQESLQIPQRSSLLAASSTDYGKIVEYVGSTTQDYTKGYFYECVRTGTDPNYVYSWERIDVQPASESDLLTITLTEEDDEYVIDKTVAEVLAAYNAGKKIEVKTNVYFEDEELHLPLFDVYHIDGTTTYSWIFSALNGGPLNSQISQFVITLPTDSDDDDETWGDITANTVVKDTYVWSTMQTAAVGYTDKVVQYVGTTDANYTKGHFYTCVQGGTAPDYTYSWEEIILGRTSLSALDDTNISTPVDGEPLVYDSTSGKWINDVGMVKPTEITWENYQLLSTAEKQAKRYIITDYPGADTNDKADKVSGATNGNFAGLDANGNLTDSGKKASDFATASHNQASNTINAMTGYTKASTAAAIAATDTLNEAIGKLEKTLDGKGTSNLAIGTTAGTACEGNDSRLSDSRTPTAHNQAASTISAGTLAGRVQANATAAATLANAQVRDITISTTDLTAGTSALSTGAVYIVYEA